MLTQVTAMIAALALLTPAAAPAQEKEHGPDSLLARLSYHSTYMTDSIGQQSPRICFALYRSGHYEISRLTKGATQTLQGTLSQDQLASVSGMLKNLDSEKSSRGGLIQQGSESLTAEVVRGGETMHYVWIDPDHKRPFPDSALSIVNWLQSFKALGASPLTLRELRGATICPPPSLEPVQPVIASCAVSRRMLFARRGHN